MTIKLILSYKSILIKIISLAFALISFSTTQAQSPSGVSILSRLANAQHNNSECSKHWDCRWVGFTYRSEGGQPTCLGTVQCSNPQILVDNSEPLQDLEFQIKCAADTYAFHSPARSGDNPYRAKEGEPASQDNSIKAKQWEACKANLCFKKNHLDSTPYKYNCEPRSASKGRSKAQPDPMKSR